MQMRDVKNLLDRLKGNEREVASYIILKTKRSRWREHIFTIDEIANKLYVNRTTVYKTIDKLLISEIIREQKVKAGQYKFMPYNRESFNLVAKALGGEANV